MQVAVGDGKRQGAGRAENGDSDAGDTRRVAVVDLERSLEDRGEPEELQRPASRQAAQTRTLRE